MKASEIEQRFNDIMECNDWYNYLDPVPVAAKYLGECVGLNQDQWMKLSIIEQHKHIEKLKEAVRILIKDNDNVPEEAYEIYKTFVKDWEPGKEWK